MIPPKKYLRSVPITTETLAINALMGDFIDSECLQLYNRLQQLPTGVLLSDYQPPVEVKAKPTRLHRFFLSLVGIKYVPHTDWKQREQIIDCIKEFVQRKIQAHDQQKQIEAELQQKKQALMRRDIAKQPKKQKHK